MGTQAEYVEWVAFVGRDRKRDSLLELYCSQACMWASGRTGYAETESYVIRNHESIRPTRGCARCGRLFGRAN